MATTAKENDDHWALRNNRKINPIWVGIALPGIGVGLVLDYLHPFVETDRCISRYNSSKTTSLLGSFRRPFGPRTIIHVRESE